MPENKLNDEKVLRMFVDRLIADKGGDTLDAKQKETLQKELLEELDERIQQAMIRALTDEKLIELEKLLDENAPDEEIESFFKNAGVDFDPAIRKAMDEFRTDYFKDKIRVSVKTSILETAPKVEETAAVPGVPAAEPAKVEAAPEAKAAETAVAPVTPAAGQPTQGTSSVAPGQSNVEGVANATSAAEQGQTPVAQPQVVAQGANATSSVSATPSVGAVPNVAPVVQTTPVAPAVSAAPVASVAPATPVASVAPEAAPAAQVVPTTPVAPVAEQPLQAAPNLMDALSTATANVGTATENVSAAPVVPTTPADGAATNAEATVSVNANAGATTNTEMTGKEA